MLQSIRDRAQGWFAWLVLGAIAVVFTFWGVTGYLGARSAKHQAAAEVGDDIITYAQVDRMYEQMMANLTAQQPENAEINESLVRSQALENLVINAALRQNSQKDRYAISPQLLDEITLRNPLFQIEGSFSQAHYNRMLANMRMTSAQYRQRLTEALLIDQVRTSFLAASMTTPFEIEAFNALAGQSRDIAYAVLPVSDYAKDLKVTREEVKNFYQTHQDKFKTSEKVKIAYVEVSLDDLKKNSKVTDKMVRDEYQQNVARYGKPEQRVLSHILISKDRPDAKKIADEVIAKIKQKQSFESLAKQYSDDPVSAAKGGQMMPVTQADLPERLGQAAFKIKTPKQVQLPVLAEHGYHILRLEKVIPPKVTPFDKVKNSIKQALIDAQARQQFTDIQSKMETLAYESPESLEPLAKALNLKIKTSKIMTRKGGEGLLANPKLLQAAFSQEVTHDGYNSDVIGVDANTAVVLRRDQYQAAKVPALKDIEQSIANLIVTQRAVEAAKTAGEKIITEMVKAQKLSGVPLDKWKQYKGIKRDNKKIPTFVLMKAFGLPRPAKGKMMTVGGLTLPKGDYAIVAVTDVLDGSGSTEQQRTMAAEQLQAIMARMGYSLYVKNVMDKSKITRHSRQNQ